jgi:hypothetical protein
MVRQSLGRTVRIWLIDIGIQGDVPLWRRIPRPPVFLIIFSALLRIQTSRRSNWAPSITCWDKSHDAHVHERVDKHDHDRNRNDNSYHDADHNARYCP